MSMRNLAWVWAVCASLPACVASVEDGADGAPGGAGGAGAASGVETSSVEQAGTHVQGIEIQGIEIQGIEIQGMHLRGFRIAGATLSGAPLERLRVERGELVAERAGAALRGASLVGARLWTDARDLAASPPAAAAVEFRIAAVTPESAAYDPTKTGSTYLYSIEQWVPERGAWVPACRADADGRRAAIPVAAIFDERGDRIEDPGRFTLACTTGVIAKCYRWGYRPWVAGYGDMAELHWACTRMARADYCGDGRSHTRDGTLINLWDTLPYPGPIQRHGLLPPLGMLFEAGWGPHGAVCLSHTRWITLGWLLAPLCPDRLIPPGIGGLACDSVLDVLDIDPSVRLFNESYLRIGL